MKTDILVYQAHSMYPINEAVSLPDWPTDNELQATFHAFIGFDCVAVPVFFRDGVYPMIFDPLGEFHEAPRNAAATLIRRERLRQSNAPPDKADDVYGIAIIVLRPGSLFMNCRK